MEKLLLVIIGILLLVIAALIIKVLSLRRSIDEIIKDFGDIIEKETNLQIRVSSSDPHIRRAAIRLNEELKKLREVSVIYSRGNNELKTAIMNISHDLRTPLTAINGYLDLLDNEDKSEDAGRYLSIIRERVESLKSLTEELFKYSVISSTKDDFKPEEIVLNSELETTLASFYGALVEKGIEPEIEICDSKVVRTLDRKSIQRIFSNIISNAIKYSEGDLKVTLDEEGTIIFSNKASGLTPTEVGKLFNRFYTVESAHHSTGLGLSIAKLLSEKNGGIIEALLIEGSLVIRISFPA